jgi:hypothetical protein
LRAQNQGFLNGSNHRDPGRAIGESDGGGRKRTQHVDNGDRSGGPGGSLQQAFDTYIHEFIR